MIIKTQSDWWQVVDDYFHWLLAIVAHHMDISSPAYDKPGDSTSKPTGRNIFEELEHLKTVRDPKLCRYFAATWGMASDAYAYSVPGWGALCDLCSEEWVFQQVPTEDEPPLTPEDVVKMKKEIDKILKS